MRRLVRAAAALLAALATAPASAQHTAPPDREGGHVAATECARCHDREAQRLRSGTHRDVLHAAALPGCETCHGPGERHAVDAANDPALITMPALLDGPAQAALCGRCHEDQIRRHGGDPRGFQVAGRSCTDCHSVHGRAAGPPLPGQRFTRRDALAAHATATGSRRCVECHPLRDQLLAQSAHASLAAAAATDGCERCHGQGSLHADAGAGRLITRPDRAADGVATCRDCHQHVDPREFHWRGRPAPYLSAGLTCTSCHVVHAPRAAPRTPDAPAPTNRRCAACHAAAFATMPGSTHHAFGALDAPLADGCGRCHLGGEPHADAGGRKDLLVPWRNEAAHEAELCLSCHQDGRTLAHVQRGAHLRNGVRCSDCHGPLHGARPGHTAALAEQRCARCHPAVAAEFALPNHHPVPEGRIGCADCHDVHGARRRAFDRELTETRCTTCHARQRGPFVFAHDAARRDGCVACHLPHGSAHRRLLPQATTQQHCLQCHGDFPAFHDQTPGAVFTDCLRCHTEVHGSNHARYLFR